MVEYSNHRGAKNYNRIRIINQMERNFEVYFEVYDDLVSISNYFRNLYQTGDKEIDDQVEKMRQETDRLTNKIWIVLKELDKDKLGKWINSNK